VVLRLNANQSGTKNVKKIWGEIPDFDEQRNRPQQAPVAN